ncbi:hypothetical protein FQN60_007941 [Etheostoma spectabile]|uniref:Carboxylesterase type B domain-containing protein n=1 Tax=Etheostoma spectabile TaxID=54343 RepID=A0A5J5CU15_9PERO|nr:hypothetical protein FQN60_007941 [Etheostoma spectabile]
MGFLSTGDSNLPGNYGLWDQHAAIGWRAISQSGVALCPWAINKNPRRFAEEVAIKVNCPIDQNMAPCLKLTDPALLTLAGSLSLSSSPDPTHCLEPVPVSCD